MHKQVVSREKKMNFFLEILFAASIYEKASYE